MNTLKLMLQAERRENPWVDVLAMERITNYRPDDSFGDTVVESVKTSLLFDEKIVGEIDATQQGHYLAGPNAYDEDEIREFHLEDHMLAPTDAQMQDLLADKWEQQSESSNR